MVRNKRPSFVYPTNYHLIDEGKELTQSVKNREDVKTSFAAKILGIGNTNPESLKRTIRESLMKLPAKERRELLEELVEEFKVTEEAKGRAR